MLMRILIFFLPIFLFYCVFYSFFCIMRFCKPTAHTSTFNFHPYFLLDCYFHFQFSTHLIIYFRFLSSVGHIAILLETFFFSKISRSSYWNWKSERSTNSNSDKIYKICLMEVMQLFVNNFLLKVRSRSREQLVSFLLGALEGAVLEY